MIYCSEVLTANYIETPHRERLKWRLNSPNLSWCAMLTKQEIDAIKPTDKLQKHSDGNMLYIFTSPTGRKVWKVLFTHDGKKGTTTLGEYPALSIKEARLKRDEIKLMLADGVTPTQKLKEEEQKKRKGMTLGELMLQYIKEEAQYRKGSKQEVALIKSFIREFPKMMQKPLVDICQLDMIEFRNQRLKVVKPATVKRDLGLLGSVFKYARQELRLITGSPLADISKPAESEHRDRRISQEEIDAILRAFSYYPTFQPINKKQQAAWAFIFALETAMRAGEITSMRWEHVADDYVLLPDTKNGTSRKVPLSKRAKELLELMRGLHEETVCTLTNPNTLSQYFWQITSEKLKIEDLRFHDARHEATTRLAQILPVQDLAKVTGHKDIKTLMKYYNPTASELADRINGVK